MVGFKVVNFCRPVGSASVYMKVDDKFAYDNSGNLIAMSFAGVYDEQGNNLGLPGWLVVTNNAPFGDNEYLIFELDTPYPNDQKYTIVVGTINGDYLIVIQPSCPVTISNSCCGVELIWRNREGGISNAYFIERKTISTDIGQGDTYKDMRNVNSYSRRDASTRQRTVSTGRVDKRMDKLIESLATSIQAWERTPGTIQNTFVDMPILVRNTAILTKEPKQKIWEWLINYDYATDLTTQNG